MSKGHWTFVLRDRTTERSEEDTEVTVYQSGLLHVEQTSDGVHREWYIAPGQWLEAIRDEPV